VNARTAPHAKLLVVALLGVVTAALPSAALPNAHEGRCDGQGVVLSLGDRPSHHNRYRARMLPGAGGVTTCRAHAWVLELRTVDGRPVEGANVGIESWMPETGRQAAVQPEISRGPRAGTYSVARLTFDEPGWWNLKIGIDAATGGDSLAFNLILQ
jgi:hypothetical protein